MAFAIFSTGATLPVVAEQPVIRLAVSQLTNDAPVIRVLDRAYEKLGIKLEITSLPRKRGPVLANEGLYDGLPVALGMGAVAFENLMPVPTPLCKIGFTLYSKQPLPITQPTLADLRGFDIGTIRGVRLLELRLEGLNLIEAPTFDHLFGLLKRDRVDVVVSPSDLQILEQHVPGSFTSQPAPLKPAFCYHVLHKAHEALLPKVAESLREMIRSGELAAIYTAVDAPNAAITMDDLDMLGPSGGLDQIREDWRTENDTPDD
ncbi:transporter substrate-binding domain-containing protein [Gimibacter soli]|uniref:Transporter substrate-binding domain-containing protein n=1 Tax=Gimibacter soli TaxID=3024400 RepID=A0AAE9XN54_9PROT|nr:transporter substrate-binding domain-containing protein [Gimibacter soli]WCL54057.1 transporter substrate-binding domain-containing protein [Gimibacter soli]